MSSNDQDRDLLRSAYLDINALIPRPSKVVKIGDREFKVSSPKNETMREHLERSVREERLLALPEQEAFVLMRDKLVKFVDGITEATMLELSTYQFSMLVAFVNTEIAEARPTTDQPTSSPS